MSSKALGWQCGSTRTLPDMRARVSATCGGRAGRPDAVSNFSGEALALATALGLSAFFLSALDDWLDAGTVFLVSATALASRFACSLTEAWAPALPLPLA